MDRWLYKGCVYKGAPSMATLADTKVILLSSVLPLGWTEFPRGDSSQLVLSLVSLALLSGAETRELNGGIAEASVFTYSHWPLISYAIAAFILQSSKNES